MLTLCVPSYEAESHRENLHRQAVWRACREHWAAGDLAVVQGEGRSRAEARNAAVRLVPASQRVLLFADADTVVPVPQLLEAVDLAEATGSLVLAYTALYRTQRNHPPLAQLLRQPAGYRTTDVSNGVLAVPRALWEEAGGFDERFVAWGGEDRAFLYTCLALALLDLEEPLRVKGHAVHLWHPHAREATRPSPAYRANVKLALRYKAAAGVERRDGPLARLSGATRDRAALEALLREPGGPRSD